MSGTTIVPYSSTISLSSYNFRYGVLYCLFLFITFRTPIKVFIVSRRAFSITFSIHTTFNSVCLVDQTLPFLTFEDVITDDQLMSSFDSFFIYRNEGSVWKYHYVPFHRNSIMLFL